MNHVLKCFYNSNSNSNNNSNSNRNSNMYTTYFIQSWHDHQRVHPGKLCTIADYNRICEEDARLHGSHVMILRENVTNITGYHWYSNGFPSQLCADTAGYVDVRTGKHYDLNGENTFFKDMHK